MNRWFRVFLGKDFFKECNLKERTLIRITWIDPDALKIEILCKKSVSPRPLLNRAQERMEIAERYAPEHPSIAVESGYNAILFVLQQKVVDTVGINVLIELRKKGRLYLGVLLEELAKAGIELSDEIRKELDILRDLRNRIVHEGFQASKEDAEWALAVAKRLITSLYPDICVNMKKTYSGRVYGP